MRKVGIFKATANIDSHAIVDHIGERAEINKGNNLNIYLHILL